MKTKDRYADLELFEDVGLPSRAAEVLPPEHSRLYSTALEVGRTGLDAVVEFRRHKLLSASIGGVVLGAGFGVQALRSRHA